MSAALTAGQLAQLRERLLLRQRELDARVASHLGPQGRAGHARELLEQDVDDASQRDADREVELARGDAEVRELGAVSAALKRIDQPDYGWCVDCGVPIPFDRLRAEPWALRCVGCEAAHEGPVSAPRL
jgi:DnaK suppressor protein